MGIIPGDPRDIIDLLPIPGAPPSPKTRKAIIKEADDVAAKDTRIPASKLIHDETGWRGQDAKIAVAVMGGESGFKTDAENFCCVGLMQVNADVHHGKYGMPDSIPEARKWLKNPVNNVRASYKLFVAVGGKWSPWDAYNNGSYRKFWGQDPLITVGDNSLSGDVADAIGAPLDAALGPIDEIASAVLSPSTWLRVGKGALGGTLLILGVAGMVFVIASKSNTVKTAASVVPVGRAAGAVKTAAAAAVA
jgi:hypothetical protein